MWTPSWPRWSPRGVGQAAGQALGFQRFKQQANLGRPRAEAEKDGARIGLGHRNVVGQGIGQGALVVQSV